jgi:hypothetical protein
VEQFTLYEYLDLIYIKIKEEKKRKMVNISDLIAGAVKRAPGGSGTTNVSQATARLGSVTRSLVPVGAWKSDPMPSRIIQGAVRRDTSVQPIARSPSQMQTISTGLSQPTPRVQLPISRGSATSSYVTQLAQSSVSRQPATRPPPMNVRQAMGGVTPPFPTGRNVVSPIVGDRTGMLPPSTLATQSAFGGETGGMGTAAPAAGAAAAADLGLGGIGESISSFGSGIVDTIKEYIPLAIKVILAVIVIKIVLWLLRGRR